MATITEPCRCGHFETIHIGQYAGSDELAWSTSHLCERCGLAMETDGWGFPPQDIRDLIIAQDGLWDLVISSQSNKDKVSAGLVAKEALEFSTREAAQFMRAIPGPVWQGTEAEVEWLCIKLRRRGVECTARLRTPTSP